MQTTHSEQSSRVPESTADRFSYKIRRPITMFSLKIAREMRLYSILSVLTLFLFGTDVVYFSRLEASMVPSASDDCEGQGEDCTAPEIQPITNDCYFAPDRQPIGNYMDLVGTGDPVKGNPEARVTVIEIFEPNCGHCRALVPIINALARQYEK